MPGYSSDVLNYTQPIGTAHYNGLIKAAPVALVQFAASTAVAVNRALAQLGIAFDTTSVAPFGSFGGATSPSIVFPAGQVVWLNITADGDGGNSQTMAVSSSGAALTWTKAVERNGSTAGSSYSAYAGQYWTVGDGTAHVITVTPAFSKQTKVHVVFISGANTNNPVGAVGNSETTSQNTTVAGYTSTSAGSRGISTAMDWNNGGGASSTDSYVAYSTNGAADGITIWKPPTPVAGTAVSFNIQQTTTPNWMAVSTEIIPAPTAVTPITRGTTWTTLARVTAPTRATTWNVSVSASGPAVRTFNGTSDYLRLDIGAAAAATLDIFTWAAVVRRTANGIYECLLGIGTSADAERAELLIRSDNTFGIFEGGSGHYTSSTTVTVSDGWVLLAITKPTGNAVGRGHKYVFSTTAWTHENLGGGNLGPITPAGAGGYFQIGKEVGAGNTDYARCDISGEAVWDGLNMSDAQVATLPPNYNNWLAFNPTTQWVLDQTATTTAVTDATGKGANQTALSGTTVTANASPMPPFVSTAPSGVTNRGELASGMLISVPVLINHAAFTPAAGSLLVCMPGAQVENRTGGGQTLSLLVSDTFGDVNGTMWVKTANSNRGSVGGNAWGECSDIWTRRVGTGAGSGVITTRATWDGATTITSGSNGATMWQQVCEVDAAHAGLLGVVANQAPTTTVTSYDIVLPSAPAATSIVFTNFTQDFSTAKQYTVPAGFYLLNDEYDSASGWQQIFAAAVATPSSQTISWTGLVATNRCLGCAVEIQLAVASTPTLWYDFSGSGTTVVDKTGNGYAGSMFTGGGTPVAADLRVNDNIGITANQFLKWLPPSPMWAGVYNGSFTCTFRFAATGTFCGIWVLAIGADTSGFNFFFNNDHLEFIGRGVDGGLIIWTDSSPNPPRMQPGKDYKLAVTYSCPGASQTGILRVYLDGIEIMAQTLTGALSLNSNNGSGFRAGFNDYMSNPNGQHWIDDIRWWSNKTLTPAEVVAIGAPFTDDFNRADQSIGGTNTQLWLTIDGNHNIVSNKVTVGSSSPNDTYLNVPLGPDQWAEASVDNEQDNMGVIFPALRMGSGAGGDLYYYWLGSPGSRPIQINRRVGGSYATVVTGVVPVPTGPFRARLEAEGNTLRAYINGVLVATGTDVGVATGKPGMLSANNGATNGTLDNFRTGPMPYVPLVFSDNFTRVDQPNLGDDWWYQDSGRNSWAITSNKANRTSNGYDFVVYNRDCGSANMWAEADMERGSFNVINIRNLDPVLGNVGANAYLGFINPGGGYMIGKVVGSAYYDVQGVGGGGEPSPSKIRLEAEGTTLRLYADGVLKITTTDSSLSVGNFAGLNAGADTNNKVDNFRCGPLPYVPLVTGLTSVVATRATTWNVAATSTTPVSTSRATTWNALQSVAATRFTLWDVKTPVTASRGTTWTVTTPVTATRATTWTVTTPITAATRATTWVARAIVTRTASTTWNTLVPMASVATKNTLWVVRATVTATAATTWTVRTPVAGTRATTWNALAGATASRATTWAAVQGVIASRGTTWNVAGALTPVTATRGTTWAVLAPVTASRASTWAVAATIAPASRGTTWAVLSGLSTNRSTTWTVRTPVTAATRDTTWVVRSVVTATRGTTWATRTAIVAATRSTTWVTDFQVVATRQTSWNTAGALAFVQATRSTTWNTSEQITNTRATSWTVRTPIAAATRATTWSVLTPVTPSTRATAWVVSQQVGVVRQTTWIVAGATYFVQALRSTGWVTKATVTSQRPTTWTIWQRAVAFRPTTWNVYLPAGPAERSTTWSIRKQVVLLRSTTWATAQASATFNYLALYPDTVLYIGTNRVKAIYQGAVKVWQSAG